MARKVVLADASPLIALERIGGLRWLRRLYGTISVTREVRVETTGARELPGAQAVAAAIERGWIRVLRQRRSEPPLPLLGPGEASTLRTALASRARTLVLLDDLLARREALRLGIAIAGTAAIVVQARRAALIPAARPVFAQLSQEGFHLGEDLVEAVLAELGEKPPRPD